MLSASVHTAPLGCRALYMFTHYKKTLALQRSFTTNIIPRKFTSRLRRRYDEKQFRRKADVILQRNCFVVKSL